MVSAQAGESRSCLCQGALVQTQIETWTKHSPEAREQAFLTLNLAIQAPVIADDGYPSGGEQRLLRPSRGSVKGPWDLQPLGSLPHLYLLLEPPVPGISSLEQGVGTKFPPLAAPVSPSRASDAEPLGNSRVLLGPALLESGSGNKEEWSPQSLQEPRCPGPCRISHPHSAFSPGLSPPQPLHHGGDTTPYSLPPGTLQTSGQRSPAAAGERDCRALVQQRRRGKPLAAGETPGHKDLVPAADPSFSRRDRGSARVHRENTHTDGQTDARTPGPRHLLGGELSSLAGRPSSPALHGPLSW
nr:uncharacterized protein LOC105479317 [Macaca nemestrina]